MNMNVNEQLTLTFTGPTLWAAEGMEWNCNQVGVLLNQEESEILHV